MTKIQFTGTREEFLAKAREMMTEESVKPLEWRVPRDHPSDPAPEDMVYCAEGVGGMYAISRKQKVGPERLLWMADDCMHWIGFDTIPDAQKFAQMDYANHILAALQTPHKAKTP